jgi:enterochelin esterase-like enzyme
MVKLLVFLFPLLLAAQRQPLQFNIKWVNIPKDPPAGVQHHVLRSAAMHQDVGFNIYLPAEYQSSPDKRYPVIYWLHGAGGNESQGLAQAVAFHAAISSGQVPPAIMVFPNGGARSEYRDWREQNVMVETMIIRELIPYVDEHYRTKAAPFGRALEGMSMGGNGALKLALKYPEMFGSVLAIAGSYRRLRLDGFYPGVAAEQQAWVSKLAQWYSPEDDVFQLSDKNLPRLGHLRIRLLIGTTDVSFQDSETLHAHLRDLSIPHEYEMLLGVSHNTQAYYDRAGLHGFQFQAAGFARAK